MGYAIRRWPRPTPGDLVGAFGDLGVLLPLAAGLIVIAHVDPGGFFVSFGLATLIAGLAFRLPRSSRDSSPPYLLREAVRRGWLPRLKGVTPAELIARIPQRLFPVRAA